MRVLNEKLQKKAEDELNEKPENVEKDLNHLKEWVEKEPHLNARTDNQWLLSFLRGCKFSLQKAKEKIDCYYTLRTLLPEFFTNRDPFAPDIQDILKLGCILPLPKTEDLSGPRIVLFRWTGTDPNVYTLVNLAKVYFMFIDVLMNEDDNCMISGKLVLLDYKDFSVNYVLQYTPSYVKKLVVCLQAAYPIRLKGMHFSNAPVVFEKIFGLFKFLMSEKLKKRLSIYSEQNFEKVYEHIPKSLLPREYGGENGSIVDIAAEWKQKIESYKDWFEEDRNYGTEEHLRSGTPHTTADMFGVEGTFRKLTID